MSDACYPDFEATIPTQPGALASAQILEYHVPDSAAPRIPRTRQIDGCGLAGLLICAVGAVGMALALGALAALMF